MLFFIILITISQGCASPAARFRRDAEIRGFEISERYLGAHRILIMQRAELTDGEPIHIYLDGDGLPWLQRNRIAKDPTSRNRLILDLMDADPTSSLLLGRPCYYQSTAGCSPAMWTNRRYGEEVVSPMADAVNDLIADYPDSRITLIGYSGGGTLAMLIAPRLGRLHGVVTVAANLDIEKWAAHHGFSPLEGSLNPAYEPSLPPAIRQFHYFGSEDEVVPLASASDVAHRQANARVSVLDGFDHWCCWSTRWTELVNRATADGPGPP